MGLIPIEAVDEGRTGVLGYIKQLLGFKWGLGTSPFAVPKVNVGTICFCNGIDVVEAWVHGLGSDMVSWDAITLKWTMHAQLKSL